MSTKKQINRFIIVGIGAVIIDFLTYKLFLGFLTYSVSKTLSFISGAFFAYIANKFFTFEKHKYCHKEISRFIVLYLGTLIANVLVNKISLITLFVILNYFQMPSDDYRNIIIFCAFLAATGTSTILNFLGQKFWVFK